MFCDKVIGKWIPLGAHEQSGLRSQLSDRIENGLIELVQLPPLQFPVEYLTYISTSLPEVDVILIVGHRVLDGRESEVHLRRAGGNARES
jgi:hypothetical protein